MDDYIKTATLDNEIETRLLVSILEEREIPHILQSYHDTAYDGLFQTQKGWGIIRVPPEHRQEVREILDELRQAAGKT